MLYCNGQRRTILFSRDIHQFMNNRTVDVFQRLWLCRWLC
jgi:hypothetical protein